MIPYLEIGSQIILLLILMVSMGKSQKFCASYLSSRGHWKLLLMFFRGLSWISILHRNIQGTKKYWGENREPKRKTLKVNQIKFTTGEAKYLIKHFIQQPLSEGYKNALELLRIRYGSPLKVLPTYRKEIRR